MTQGNSASTSLPRPHRLQEQKLVAHAEHLLDGVLWLKERHAMFRPMLDKSVMDRRGAGKKRSGFMTIKRTLFFSCVLDIVNLCLDADDRTPSIVKIMKVLTDNPLLIAELRRKFSVWVSSPTEEEKADPDIMRSIRALEEKNTAKRAAQFDQRLQELRILWEALRDSEILSKLKEVRNKHVAHTELVYEGEKYRPVDLEKLGLKWDDISVVIGMMQGVTEAIGHVARAASFAWDHLDEQHQRHATEFWGEGAVHSTALEDARGS